MDTYCLIGNVTRHLVHAGVITLGREGLNRGNSDVVQASLRGASERRPPAMRFRSEWRARAPSPEEHARSTSGSGARSSDR